MNDGQITILAILAATIGMFLWGHWRHDMVALGSLLACVLAGLVPAQHAFNGFGHPAVITVACVLVLSRTLQTSGVVDALTMRVLPANAGPGISIAALTSVGAVLSAFMNNVGALALLMPVGIQIAGRLKLPPARVLMPLAFGSILGGMTTLIGTPPNLIVSSFRAETGDGGFSMFDFTPVGLAVAAGGVIFIALVGWRLVPPRERAGAEGFEMGAYLTEVRIPKDSKAAGKTLRALGKALEEADAQVVGLIRGQVRVDIPKPGRKVIAEDILVIEAEPEALASVLSNLGLELVEDVPVTSTPPTDGNAGEKDGAPPPTPQTDEEIALGELAVRPGSDLIGQSATDIDLRTRFGINLLALSRQGQRSIRRLRSARIRAGDVLLMQGAPSAISAFASALGCVPLAERALRIPNKRRAIASVAIMACAVGGAAFGLLPAAITFAAGVLAAMALQVVPPRKVYDAVDWPVVVLLGALIPVAGAMATTGAADVLARLLMDHVAYGNAIVALVIVLVVTMTLSDFMNNAATAAVMCPVAISAASQLSVRTDPFLMAVAIGASCAFLTPIGHQNNTLILGPGGLRFGDYWRLGLPVEALVVVIAIPMLLLVWPL